MTWQEENDVEDHLFFSVLFCSFFFTYELSPPQTMRISDFRDSWLELLPFPCLQSRKSEKNKNRKTEDKSKKKRGKNKQNKRREGWFCHCDIKLKKIGELRNLRKWISPDLIFQANSIFWVSRECSLFNCAMSSSNLIFSFSKEDVNLILSVSWQSFND